MCGIAGFINNSKSFSNENLCTMALKMGEAIAYRGPDVADAWADEKNGVALAHRRLSIIDLSPAGNQPMSSSCGRFVMVYNGEVYNTEDLRKELIQQGFMEFRGHSDTEVILEGFAIWGILPTIERMIGMFAIAVWDRKYNQLTLVRDRLGIKPLYYSLHNGKLLFGSEMKALYAHPEFKRDLNKDALAAFLRHNYIPAPHTAHKTAQNLQPGCILTIDGDLSGEPLIEKYWSMEDVIQKGHSNPFSGNDREVVDHLEDLLADAIKRRMVADVPLGAFLSGGIDSSLVVALMQKQSSRPVKSFSIGFNEEGYNEAHHAAIVAKHLGTEHTELYVSPEDARDVIPNLAKMYDEPFADSSQIPTYLVSALAKEHVTVALSGDGGDELFAGYNQYTYSQKMGDNQ